MDSVLSIEWICVVVYEESYGGSLKSFHNKNIKITVVVCLLCYFNCSIVLPVIYINFFYRALCGDYFTLFLSDNGLVLSCGQGNNGNLGHGDFEALTRPRLIDDLIMLDIISLSTGSHHVAACTAEGVAYTWGCGGDGRLGHGNEDNL